MSDASLNRLPALSPRAARNAEAVLNASLTGPSFLVGLTLGLVLCAAGTLVGGFFLLGGVAGLILAHGVSAWLSLGAGAFLIAIAVPLAIRQIAILRVALRK